MDHLQRAARSDKLINERKHEEELRLVRVIAFRGEYVAIISHAFDPARPATPQTANPSLAAEARTEPVMKWIVTCLGVHCIAC